MPLGPGGERGGGAAGFLGYIGHFTTRSTAAPAWDLFRTQGCRMESRRKRWLCWGLHRPLWAIYLPCLLGFWPPWVSWIWLLGRGLRQILKTQGQVWGPSLLAPPDQDWCCTQKWTRQGAQWAQGCSPWPAATQAEHFEFRVRTRSSRGGQAVWDGPEGSTHVECQGLREPS